MVPKDISRKHLVINYRGLNKVRQKFVWPMPKVENLFSKLNCAKYFFTLNLHTVYHHIPLNEDSIPKQFLHLLLENMSAWRFLLDWHKHQHTWKNSWIKYWRTYPLLLPTWIIIMYSKTAEEHLDHMQQVFHKFYDAKLSMKLSKCHFFAKEIQYLGHVLSTTGIKPLPSKNSY